MTRDRLKPPLHQGFSNCTHVERLKNRGKPYGEAVLIFWLGELQIKVTKVCNSKCNSIRGIVF
jgi:hypothetical protein